MKDLTTLTDAELMAAYGEAQEFETADYIMDGSGDCGHLIAQKWESIWERFNTEFEKREMIVSETEECPF